MKITVVVPVFNEHETLEALAQGITEDIAPHEHRIVVVDDGSTDGSYEVLTKLHNEYDTVDVIKLRRNMGKATALAVAFARADGDAVIMMDADLQDDPKEIPRLLAKLDEGYDMVCGYKANRKDPWHKTIPSRIYNWWIRRTFSLELHDINTGFKVMRTEVAQRLPLYGEMHRMIVVFAADMGYKITEVPVEHHPRRFGESKYGFSRFWRGFIDAQSARFFTKYHGRPGHYFNKAAGIMLLMGCAVLLLVVLLSVVATVTPESSAWGWPIVLIVVGCLCMVATLLLTAGISFKLMGDAAELVVHGRRTVDLSDYVEEEL